MNESFFYRGGILWCEGVPLEAIAEPVGTPVYVYSVARVLRNIRRLQTAFGPLGASIHYSLKANANLALLGVINEAGVGVDAVSAGEIARARLAGIPPSRIVFAGVGKTRAELEYALDTGVGWINVESQAEMALLETLAADRRQIVTVALRLNPGVEAATHRHIATGHAGAKFGIEPEVLADILDNREGYPHLFIAGIHVHIGSQLTRVDATLDAVRLAQELADPHSDVRTLNIGGGFPVRYDDAETLPEPAEFAKALQPVLDGWHIMIEPGRAVVADAGLLLVSVLYVKEQYGRRFVIVDGSMTELLRPALYGAEHPIIPLREPESELVPATVVGPVCESTDVLSPSARLPRLDAGDRMAVLDVGAYGMVMASNYNMRLRPPEVLVEGRQWRVVRRRETLDDLLRLEQ